MEFNDTVKEFFKNEIKEVKIPMYPENTERIFKRLDYLYNFFEREYEFWKPCTQGVASQIRDHFNTILNYLKNSFHNTNISNIPSSSLIFKAIHLATIRRFPCVYSSTSIAKLIKDRYQVNYLQADAVCNYLLQDKIPNISSNLEYFKGVMYAFLFKDYQTAATKEYETEKESLLNLRNKYSNELNELHNEFLTRLQNIDSSCDQFITSVSDWKDETQRIFDNFINEGNKRKKELEELYQEKLRLEGPATYWLKLKEEYEQKGKLWRKWSLWTGGVSLAYFSILIYKLPDTILSQKESLNINSIKATLILGLIASIFIYLVRFFVKLSTSAYHLARDASERYQLTFVYLSLLNEKAITEQERNIVLQSLFSRADTGLLKGDSAPSFPEGALSQIFKGFK